MSCRRKYYHFKTEPRQVTLVLGSQDILYQKLVYDKIKL